MNIDFLRKLKLVLYAVSLGEIFLFSYLAERTGNNIKMMFAALVLILINFAVYKTATKYHKKADKKDGI